MINNITIMGRLCAAPELKKTSSGTSYTSFTVAVDRSMKSKDGERQTDFLPVNAWRGTAEFITKYFDKGAMIALTGELQSNVFTDKEGNKRTSYRIVANQVSFCGGKKESGATAVNDTQDFDTAIPDDLPF